MLQCPNLDAPPSGTPPLLRVVLAMNQPQVTELLTNLINWLRENDESISAELMKWIFALLSVLEKPLDPDMCSALRDLARACGVRRNERRLGDPEAREFSCFICIIGRYFDQTDLADSY